MAKRKSIFTELFIPGTLLLIVCMFDGCFSAKVLNQNFAYLYRKDIPGLHPKFSIFHNSDNSSRLYFSIASDPVSKNTESKIQLSYRLFDSEKLTSFSDSGSIAISHHYKDTSLVHKGFIDIRTPLQKDYYLEITVKENNNVVKSFLDIEKSNLLNAQNFIVSNANENFPALKYHFTKNQKLNVNYRDSSIKKLFVKYYSREFPIAAPPFDLSSTISFNYTPDSLFIFENLKGNSIEFKQEGFYLFQTDTSTRAGLTLFCFPGEFPMLTSVSELLSPLRYITTKKEFTELAEIKNTKNAVDKYWITAGGTQERSKILIREYYGRVQDANQYFSSYLEGWKTDRGLIFIILGPPKLIYKTFDQESWIYGEVNNRFSLNFTFYKTDNPFTKNDFSLSRTAIYENPWYKAVEAWRQGRIYNKN